MKTRNISRILETEFKAKIKEIIKKYAQYANNLQFTSKTRTSQLTQSITQNIVHHSSNKQVTFQKFLQILSQNGIRLYSKTQFSKLRKCFISGASTSSQQNTSSDKDIVKCRIQLLLGFLQLVCIQQSLYQKDYSIVKVSDQYRHVGKYYGIKQQQLLQRHDSIGLHNPQNQCINNLVKVLRSKYGSHTNWFRALGGMTVCMSIQREIFEKNVKKILFTTKCNQYCIPGIINLFITPKQNKELLQSSKFGSQKSKQIKWQNFIQLVNSKKIKNNLGGKQQRVKTVSDFSQVNNDQKMYFSCNNWNQTGRFNTPYSASRNSYKKKQYVSNNSQHRERDSLKMSISHQKNFQRKYSAVSYNHRQIQRERRQELVVQPKSCKLNTRKSFTPTNTTSKTCMNQRFFKCSSNLNRNRQIKYSQIDLQKKQWRKLSAYDNKTRNINK